MHSFNKNLLNTVKKQWGRLAEHIKISPKLNNKMGSRTAIFFGNAARTKLIENTTKHFYQHPNFDKEQLDSFMSFMRNMSLKIDQIINNTNWTFLHVQFIHIPL